MLEIPILKFQIPTFGRWSFSQKWNLSFAFKDDNVVKVLNFDNVLKFFLTPNSKLLKNSKFQSVTFGIWDFSKVWNLFLRISRPDTAVFYKYPAA